MKLFCENWHGASFYIKEQTQKYKFEIWLLKSTILDPQKSAFLVFEEKPQNFFSSSCFSFDSAFKTIDAQIFFWLVFLKTHKKSYWPSKTPFWPFLAVNKVFLCVLNNTDQNNICASIVFKAKTKEKYEEIFFYGFNLKTQKCSFFGINQFLSNFFQF